MISSPKLAFDHVHLISRDPHATASWYVEKLGGELVKSVHIRGAAQIYVKLAGAMVIIRGQRIAERIGEQRDLQWGVDHFGLRVWGDFDGFCAALQSKGVVFSLEPTDFNPITRIAFIKAPDGVSVELLNRKEQP